MPFNSRSKTSDKNKIDAVKIIEDKLGNSNVSLYEICFVAMEIMNSSLSDDTKFLIAKSNEFYSTNSSDDKNNILSEIAFVLSKYNEADSSDARDINEFLLKITRRGNRKSNIHLVKQF